VDKSTYVQETRREVETAVKAAKRKASATSTTASQPRTATTAVPMSGEKATAVNGDAADACADRLAAVALDQKLRAQEEEQAGIAAHRPRRA
jgi:cytoskeletal protein RodZ